MRSAIVNAAQYVFGALTAAAVATTPTLAQDKDRARRPGAANISPPSWTAADATRRAR